MPVSGEFRRKDSGFAVCGENPASVSQFVAVVRHGRSSCRACWRPSRVLSSGGGQKVKRRTWCRWGKCVPP